MTQEGQALPSPTPPENPVEPSATTTGAELPAETYSEAVEDRPEGSANDKTEEGKQEEDIGGREEVEQQDTHREGNGWVKVKNESGESELKREGVDCTGEEHEHTKREAEEMKQEEEGKENEDMQSSTEAETSNSQHAGRLVEKNHKKCCQKFILYVCCIHFVYTIFIFFKPNL